MQYIVIYLVIINLITCILYGVDKLKAVIGGRRISEKTLLSFAFVGGSLGALIGMEIFRHKTRRLKFRICVPFFMIVHIVLIVLLCMFFYK